MSQKPRSSEWYSEVPRSTRLPTMMGVAAVVVGVVGFAVWANTAPIAGAVVTSGVFVATGQNKTVQHLEGGVIREILVREGDHVQPGQPLIALDDTAPRAELRRLTLRHFRLAAMEARLRAEIDDQPEITFPPDLLTAAHSDADVAELIEGQQLTFRAKRANQMSDITTLRQGISALQERIAGTTTQQKATQRQLSLFEEELQTKSQLLNSGMVRRSEVLALQRAQANAQGEIGRLSGDLGDSRERIARLEEQIRGVKSTAIKSAVEQFHEVQADFNDVRERIRSAEKVLSRITIAAPVKGIVVKLRYHTAGGVIEPGKSVLEIVPLEEDLIIEARVRPQDITHVKQGQIASVRLTAFSQRTTPMVTGAVIYVSADALPDDRRTTSNSSDLYVTRVRLDSAEAKLIKDFDPTPGMPAEVYIKTAERTFFEYLAKPIRDTMTRAFRES
jgi:HlyD family secretion protein